MNEVYLYRADPHTLPMYGIPYTMNVSHPDERFDGRRRSGRDAPPGYADPSQILCMRAASR